MMAQIAFRLLRLQFSIVLAFSLVFAFSWALGFGKTATAQPPAGQAKPAETDEPAEANQADEPAELGQEWVRIVYDEQKKPTAMQVAIVRYTGSFEGKRRVVDLVGAVHVGDAAYYAQLNKRFRQYDALLYELVAAEGVVVDPKDVGRNDNPVAALQNGMKTMLELEHQLELIDYRRPNFVHADMSPDEFLQSMENRGESLLKMYFRLVGQGIAMQSKQTAQGKSMDFDLLKAFFAKDRARKLKIVVARQMAEMESMLGGMGGGNGSTIITERNKAAFEVLRRELGGGKLKLGVFYGAAHLTDMDSRLRKDFGLQPEEITWLTAWDLSAN